ncbi:MAG: hypothetical protein ABSF50_03050 [Burkholderiaceae bacterium]|jgi:hypothetical protein
MVYVKPSNRRSARADRPSVSDAPHLVDADGVKFFMMLDGESHSFSIGRDVLMRLERSSDSSFNLEEAFVRQKARIVGIAGRALSAGVRMPVMPLTSQHFAEIAERA